MDFVNTSSIFYLKSLRDILNIRDNNFDVERMIDFSNDMQKFLNACVKNCGWETRSDVDYWKYFDSYGNLLIEFYKAPFSTPGGLFLGEELKVLRHLLREFENNEIRRALRRFVGTIDRRILQRYTCVRALYDKFSKWDRKKVKMNKLIRKSSVALQHILFCPIMESVTDPIECSICLEHLTIEVFELDCRHRFHRPCIRQTLHSNINACPNCRTRISCENRISLTEICGVCLEAYTFNPDNLCDACEKTFEYFETILELCHLDKPVEHLPIGDWIDEIPDEKKEELIKKILDRYTTLFVNCQAYFESRRFDDDDIEPYLEDTFFLFELTHRKPEETSEDEFRIADFIVEDLEESISSLTYRFKNDEHKYASFVREFANLLSELYTWPSRMSFCACSVLELDALMHCMKKYEKETIRRVVIHCIETVDSYSLVQCNKLKTMYEKFKNDKYDVAVSDLYEQLSKIKRNFELFRRHHIEMLSCNIFKKYNLCV
ncbi:hypothetical protein AVEN_242289-1 [Araneus ventricosus]|uniref:RING-type domain-containing protein n=1 Tax=Araneus ventricosus TaxID=182803 RepID=A0A4Y2VWF6_ARAVE|nr:hypothetical protein AVEN_242289-1 [Araneus ventricosus]